MNFIFGATFLLFVSSALAVNYCRNDLCRSGTHIACQMSNNKWGPDCGKNPKIYDLTEKDKKLILSWHNKQRSELASGNVYGYSPARNMKELKWNVDLANIACLNARRCKMQHDECRNTEKHRYAGQNLAISGTSPKWATFQEAYEMGHTKWFNEHKDCNMRSIRQYPRSHSKPIGHFTQIISDKADEIGCCVSMFTKPGTTMNFYYVVCNYSYTNMADQSIYVEGKPSCSKFSKDFKGLCAAE